jgi:quercetin dioxygenase-like cupin family protein
MSDQLEIGRTIDKNGIPVNGTGVWLNKHSATAKLLLSQPTIVISNPVTREFGARVQVQNSNGTLTTKGLGIIPPGCIGPPKHIHPNYLEEFTVVEGSFYFYLGNKKQMINSGEVVVVPPGMAHTFQPANTSQVNSFLVEAKPAGKLEEVIRTVWALAHEGKTNKKGQPNEFWQRIAIGYELNDDTLFVSPPPFVQKLMFRLFGKLAIKKGYKGIYDKYSADEYWMRRVEQIK